MQCCQKVNQEDDKSIDVLCPFIFKYNKLADWDVSHLSILSIVYCVVLLVLLRSVASVVREVEVGHYLQLVRMK